MDAELAEFRRLVGNEPGRYRLDAMDEDGRQCDGACPAYLHISEPKSGGESAVSMQRSGGMEMELMRELVRANTEMVRNIADKFASVMDSAAVLIRAADGAGIPARQPVVAELPAADGEEDEDDDPRNGGSELTSLLSQVMPLVQMAIAQKLGKAGPAPRNAAPEPDEDDGSEDCGGDTGTEATPEPMTAEQMQHIVAVQARLSPDEARLAEAVARELSPAEVIVWLKQLCALSVDDAAALIRKTISESRGRKQGGAS